MTQDDNKMLVAVLTIDNKYFIMIDNMGMPHEFESKAHFIGAALRTMVEASITRKVDSISPRIITPEVAPTAISVEELIPNSGILLAEISAEELSRLEINEDIQSALNNPSGLEDYKIIGIGAVKIAGVLLIILQETGFFGVSPIPTSIMQSREADAELNGAAKGTEWENNFSSYIIKLPENKENEYLKELLKDFKEPKSVVNKDNADLALLGFEITEEFLKTLDYVEVV